ncbi:hypothetical protein [Ruegeria lacuscaerulensis]|uniref:hypothetical protein n=1 Tax=Ruegeria lacuscaerulensis TaxID=55218 RepID=UPI00147F2EC2|nr:hypothetical protein [Ruegeria lacuscaerulensis]
MNWLGTFGALAAAVLGLLVYFKQKETDRAHQILAERRSLYLEYAEVMARHMFSVIDVNSSQHLERRDALNVISSKLAVVATAEILKKHRELLALLRDKELGDIEGIVEDYFDPNVQKLFDDVLQQMREDALPEEIRYVSR